MPPLPPPIRFALIGAGHIAKRHADILKTNPHAALAAVTDISAPRAEQFAATHNIPKTYPDAQAIFNDPAIHAVILCTPPKPHAALIQQALRAGKAVLCEKPVVVSLAELDACIAVEKQTHGTVAGVFQWRYGRAIQMLEELVAAGTLGKLLWTNTQVAWLRDAAYYSVPWRGTWESESGGVTVSQSIHALDAMLAVTGPASRITASIATLNHKIEVEDYSAALLEFPAGGRGVLQCTVDCMENRSHLMFGFEKATFISNAVAYHAADMPCTFTSKDPALQEHLNSVITRWTAHQDRSVHKSQLDHFIDDLLHGTRPRIGLEACRPSAQLITGLYKSAATNQPVSLPITPDDPYYHNWNGVT